MSILANFCVGDRQSNVWNANCLFWTAIDASAPAFVLLVSTSLYLSTLQRFTSRRTGGKSWRASSWQALSLWLAAVPSLFVLARFIHAQVFEPPQGFQQFHAIVTTLSWSLALLLQTAERARRLPRLGWPLRSFFLASAVVSSLHAPLAAQTLFRLDPNHSPSLVDNVEEAVFAAQFIPQVVLALVALFAPFRRFAAPTYKSVPSSSSLSSSTSLPVVSASSASTSSTVRHGKSTTSKAVSSSNASVQTPLLGVAQSDFGSSGRGNVQSSGEHEDDLEDEDNFMSCFAEQRVAAWRADKGELDDDDEYDEDGDAAMSRSKPNPVQSVSCLSRITFSWLAPLLRVGERRSLQNDDIPPLPEAEATRPVSQRFQDNWLRRLADAARLQLEDGDQYVEEEAPKPYDDDEDENGDEDGNEKSGDSDSADKSNVVESVKVDSNGYQALNDSVADSANSSSQSSQSESSSSSSSSSSATAPSAMGFVSESSSASSPRLRLRPKHQASLLGALMDTFGLPFYLTAFLKLVSDCALFVGPLALNRIISFLSDPDAPLWHGLAWVGASLAVAIMQSLCLQAYFMRCLTIGMNVRAAVVDAIFDKTLRLSRQERQYRNSGQAVNLMSVDAAHLEEMLPYTHMCWSAPLQIALALFLLYQQLGVAVLAGLGVMVLLVPVNICFTARVSRLQADLMARRDARVKLTSELVTHMQFVKMSAWEACFGAAIGQARRAELELLWRFGLFDAGQDVFWRGLPVLVSLTMFATYTLLGNALTPARAFTALALLDILQFPMSVLPYVINDLLQAAVSLRRLSDFLLAPELYRHSAVAFESSEESPGDPQQPAIELVEASYCWDDDDLHRAWTAASASQGRQAPELSALHSISLRIARGVHVCVVGPTGSGKSALALALVGDLHHVAGTHAVRGRVAYTEQMAWIQNMTLRDNIVFGRPFDAARYGRVLSACALQPDLDALPAGDQTEIGSNGINLSGGQRQRVSLARALYADADLYVLDDPFSALDAHVTAHVMRQALGDLLRGRTVVLVSHALSVLPLVDQVVVLEKGRLTHVGSYAQLSAQGLDFGRLLETDKHQQGDAEQDEQKQSDTPHGAAASNHRVRVSSAASEDMPELPPHDGSAAEPDRSLSLIESLPPSPPSISSRQPSLPVIMSSSSSSAASQPDLDDEEVPSRNGRLASPPAVFAAPAHSTGLPRVASNSEFKQSENSSFCSPHALSSSFGGRASQSQTTAGSSSSSHQPTISSVPSSSRANQGETTLTPSGNSTIQGGAKDSSGKAVGQLIEDEERSHGSVSWHVYQAYIEATGGWLGGALPTLLLLSLTVAAQIGTDRWLAFWSDLADQGEAGRYSSWFLLGIYAALAIGAILFTFFCLTVVMLISFKSANIIHENALRAILRAPMSFFDVTPIGRVLNRMSADINAVDEKLPNDIFYYLSLVLRALGVLVLISSISPLLLVLALPVAWFYGAVQTLYLASSRDLKRLTSISRSPVYSHFVESLRGCASIRAFGVQPRFRAHNEQLIDDTMHPEYMSYSLNRWLAIRLELVGNLITALTALIAVANRGALSPALGALSISYTMSVTSTLNWMVRGASDLENDIVGFERVQQLIAVPSEAPDVIEDQRPSPSWPQHGAIEVQSVRLRYRPELPLVLHGLSFSVRPCEKVGVVGRTGSGKSSLLLALLRLVECLPGGGIRIDGVDISRMGLADLRARLAILPQDPVLFSGTLRFNLDPLSQCKDDDLWEALERVGLGGFVKSLSGMLDFHVTEGGANVSQGQRQQIALARTILRKPKIFLMDEGTSAVDHKTDAFIQETIRKCFADATVLTIAHRVETIMGSDRILVLDKGRLAEFDSPANLLANPNSLFRQLVEASNHAHPNSSSQPS